MPDHVWYKCFTEFIEMIGDGYCDVNDLMPFFHNSSECNFDGGDCIGRTSARPSMNTSPTTVPSNMPTELSSINPWASASPTN